MLDWSDRHYRYFMRQITKHTYLYSEMIVADAIIHGNRDYLLKINPIEHPVAIQLGGSDPDKLALAAQIAQDYGYDEVNLNLGCPSTRVQAGNFGACLMQTPLVVLKCIEKMQLKLKIPITIKHRVGIDYQQNYQFLADFVNLIKQSGIKKFIIHARNAILNGLSPKQNREIPPLCYDMVYKLKQQFPELEIIINGGIKNHQQIKCHLDQVDGIMIGREAYHNPYLLADFDQQYYQQKYLPKNRDQIAEIMGQYLVQNSTIKPHHITRHMMGLYYNTPIAKIWRTGLSNKLCGVQDYYQLLQSITTQ